jgi:hypothetical protein
MRNCFADGRVSKECRLSACPLGMIWSSLRQKVRLPYPLKTYIMAAQLQVYKLKTRFYSLDLQ